jgi:cytochrome P450
MGCILRLVLSDPSILARARTELDAATSAALLSTPIRYDETLQHLPFFVACIKEGLRLFPPAPNLFPRVTPKGGKVIDGHYVPGGMDVTSHAYTVQRDKGFYGRDAEDFQPERWMQSEKRNIELEAAQFTFGIGPRMCLGKDVAKLEMYKLLPEVSVPPIAISQSVLLTCKIIRRFDIQVKKSGRYVVDGGVAYNVDFLVELDARNSG